MDPVLLRLTLVAVLLLVTTAAGLLARRRDGRVTLVAGGPLMAAIPAAQPAHAGPRAILFGSATCAPCDTVKSMLREVESERDDFEWTYIDAADHLDVAEAHNVRRVPTLLLLDQAGAVVARTSGVPDRTELRAALPVRQAS